MCEESGHKLCREEPARKATTDSLQGKRPTASGGHLASNEAESSELQAAEVSGTLALVGRTPEADTPEDFPQDVATRLSSTHRGSEFN